VQQVCDLLRSRGLGLRAAIRVEPQNDASVRVAQKAGFRFVCEFASTTDRDADGTPKLMNLYVLEL
jgi:RimJ/RimL family protein N-acetyltransferase